MATDPSDIDIDSRHLEFLKELAREKGQSSSEVLGEILEKACGQTVNGDSERSASNGKSCLELAQEIGLIGAAGEEHPEDLSTNPKHFDGFGSE